MPSATFLTEMDRLRGANPRTRVEFIDKLDVVTDISSDYLEGANLETIKERAPDEIQSGTFDIVLDNTDDRYSEYKVGSLIFDTDYHGSRIRVSQGFLFDDGTEEYEVQAVGYIDQILTDPNESKITFRCRDLLWRVMDQRIRQRPTAEVPVAGINNIGNGNISAINTLPFTTIAETWTLTCTLAGGNGVATFSLVGSSSGSIGPVTSGTQFISTTSGIKFTINAGLTPWQVGDVFTWATEDIPQWDQVNAAKIIWEILTGYDWDTDTIQPWADKVFDFDRTQSSANTELDYDSFVETIDNVDQVGVFDIKGFIPYDTEAVEFMQNLLLMFIGSLFVGNDGRIKLKSFIPIFGAATREFSDAKKVTLLGYNRTIDEVINAVSVKYKATDNWEFSDESVNLDGAHVDEETVSIGKFKKLGLSFDIPWWQVGGGHVQDFANKLIGKFSDPPLNMEFVTGMDALTTEIGDNVLVTDQKYGLSQVTGEVARILKVFDGEPAQIEMRVRRDSALEEQFGFIGSEVDEGDGLSPQSDDFSTATATDKQFAYFGNAVDDSPDYRYF